MKIVKIGTFENGLPVGWHIDPSGTDAPIVWQYRNGDSNTAAPIILNISDDKRVLVNGIEVVEWTEQLRQSL